MAFSSSIIGENTELMPNFRMLVSALGQVSAAAVRP
jgi:hypothetical protein